MFVNATLVGFHCCPRRDDEHPLQAYSAAAKDPAGRRDRRRRPRDQHCEVIPAQGAAGVPKILARGFLKFPDASWLAKQGAKFQNWVRSRWVLSQRYSSAICKKRRSAAASFEQKAKFGHGTVILVPIFTGEMTCTSVILARRRPTAAGPPCRLSSDRRCGAAVNVFPPFGDRESRFPILSRRSRNQ